MKKSVAICSHCGSPVEYDNGDEFAYCPMCENDQVEITKRTHKLKNNLKKYAKIGEWECKNAEKNLANFAKYRKQGFKTKNQIILHLEQEIKKLKHKLSEKNTHTVIYHNSVEQLY